MSVRIGVLGAATIAAAAIIRPAQRVAGVSVAAIAARDPARARAAAGRHGIPEAHRTYESLLADPTLDAVYLPLPSSLHGEWMLRAIAAGKHVLCEKPFTANAAEAQEVADAAAASGLVVMQAFHYRYHPLMLRLVEIAGSGEIGRLTRIEADFHITLPPGGDIRWQPDLGGGSTMDVGCYPIHLVRSVAGEEPTVVRARAWADRRGIDRRLEAELIFPSGVTARIDNSMWSATPFSSTATLIGTRGSVHVTFPYHPQVFHRFSVRTEAGRHTERFARRSTFDFQLEAFRGAVVSGAPMLTGADDAVATMTVIDEVYRAAGLRPRVPFAQASG
ncbi:MAG: hypothetical protein RI885_86 [Actinomycetota bacterium]